MKAEATELTMGRRLVVSAYVLWGVLPAFWKLLSHVPAEQVLFQRIFWSVVILGAAFTAGRRWGSVSKVVRDGALPLVALSALLLGVNWVTYIEAIQHGRLAEASLGYFICPLISIALGRMFYGERLGMLRIMALSIVAAGVVARALSLGAVPWLALVIALSFSFYSLVRKRSAIDPWAGFFLETCMLLPAAIFFAGWSQVLDRQFFVGHSWSLALLFVASGLVTAAPMVLLICGARRVPLQFLGASQYLTPTLSLILAVVCYGERVSPAELLSFGLIWIGIGLYLVAPVIERRRGRGQRLVRAVLIPPIIAQSASAGAALLCCKNSEQSRDSVGAEL